MTSLIPYKRQTMNREIVRVSALGATDNPHKGLLKESLGNVNKRDDCLGLPLLFRWI